MGYFAFCWPKSARKLIRDRLNGVRMGYFAFFGQNLRRKCKRILPWFSPFAQHITRLKVRSTIRPRTLFKIGKGACSKIPYALYFFLSTAIITAYAANLAPASRSGQLQGFSPFRNSLLPQVCENDTTRRDLSNQSSSQSEGILATREPTSCGGQMAQPVTEADHDEFWLNRDGEIWISSCIRR